MNDPTDIAIHSADHPCISGTGVRLIGIVLSRIQIGPLRPNLIPVLVYGILRYKQLHVRNREGRVTEKRCAGILLYEFLCPYANLIVLILDPSPALIAL